MRCEGISLVVGVVAGLLMLGLLRHDYHWAWFWSVLWAVVVGGAVLSVLRWAFGGNESLLAGHEAVKAPKAPVRAAKPAPKPVQAAAPAAAPVAAPEEVAGSNAQPVVLLAARDGQADDLKKIKGVGPKLETVLHEMGVYHFDQIAGWNAAEVAWVDENLEGFRGRVSRDDWVAQARLLAAGGATAFSARVDDGKVY